MLNCIIATMRPKARTKRPSTPVSFIRRRMDLGIVRGEDLQEQPVGLRVSGGSLWSISRSDLARGPHRVRMQHQIVLLREAEHADQVERIAREHTRARRRSRRLLSSKKSSLSGSALAAVRPEPRHHPAQHRRGLGLAVLQRRCTGSRCRSPTSLATRK